MRKNKKIYSFFEVASALFMMMVLFWLTISFSLAYVVGQQLSNAEGKSKVCIFFVDIEGSASDCNSPLNNPTEEKAPGGLNPLAEEYLHDNHHADFIVSIDSRYFKCESASKYVGFHGELLVPPPNCS